MPASNNDLIKSLLNDRLLNGLIAKRDLPITDIYALLEFASEISKNYDDAVRTVSSILGQDSTYSEPSRNLKNVELQDHINKDIIRRMESLEKQLSEQKNASPKRLVDSWQIVQAIMTVLAFSGTVLSLFKIFKP